MLTSVVTFSAWEPDQLAGFAWPERTGLLVFGRPDLPPISEPTVRRDLADPIAAAAALYATLHDWDERNLDLVIIVPPPDSSEWGAIRDRLSRAAKPVAS